ncbi:MAG TPA: hypothetical protein VFS38_07900 [Actinomycetota bacterium]|nr:hypothetical protein [Actinomycetota bacterium]
MKTDRTAPGLALVAFVLCAAAAAGSVGFFAYNGWTIGGPRWDPGEIVLAPLFFTFPVVGYLIASRLPRNPIGWILLGIGLVWELYFVAENYIWRAYVGDPGSLWRPDLVVSATSSLWVPGVGLIGTFLILLFPDGHLPSPRWRPLAWISGLTLGIMFVINPFVPVPLRDVSSNVEVPRGIANPLGVAALEPFVSVWQVSAGLIPLCILGCAISMVLRYRRSRGHERLQLKWVASAAAGVAVAYLVLMSTGLFAEGFKGYEYSYWWEPVVEAVVLFSFALIPVATGIAILKHRLYDIDVIINRALVYGLLTVVLALVYVAGVVGLGGAVRGVTGQGDNSLAIAATTLAIAGLFGPARVRVQRFIDRRFYRHKYDAAKTVEIFSTRLRDEIDLDALCSELVDTVAYTMQPTKVSVWLRGSSPT